MRYWKVIYIVCGNCGHRNLPHRVPIEAAIMLVKGWESECKSCGKPFYYKAENLNRPILRKAQMILEQQNASFESENEG